MQIDHYTPELVEERLCNAGRTLMALRVPGCRPARHRSGMPDVLPQAIAAEFGTGYLKPQVRIDPPLSVEIDNMDRSMGWIMVYLAGESPAVIRHRRVMLSRCLIHPVTDRHLASYRLIASRLGVSHTHVQALWEAGLGRIASGLNRQGVDVQFSSAATVRRIKALGRVAEVARDMLANDMRAA